MSNYLDGNKLYLNNIPVYASNITTSRGGLGGEITVPSNSLDYWNSNGNEVVIDGKNCIELDSNNIYQFNKRNLVKYMESVQQEYISGVLHKYKTYNLNADLWKNINKEGWEYRYNRIKKRTFNLKFDLYMKITKDTDSSINPRYYIASHGSDEYYFVIAYCLIPKYTNIRIEKQTSRAGISTYTFYLDTIGLEDTYKIVNEVYEDRVAKNLEKDINELYIAASSKEIIEPVGKVTTTKVYNRDPEVSAYVKKRAEGKCDLCKKSAPFLDTKGYPYLEEHHVIRLADGGTDSIDNALALCPNCHRKVHIIGSDTMKEKLQKRLAEYAKLEEKIKGNN